ncbi:L-aspartate oxidase [Synechococcus sp. LTW-R]|uniref:L-aspartate oxidase n=1 Tax=Synechococcus sp. LTW-R TaxID=2751170 RepID=UPI001628EEB8|nr:L-aspartate oxidase [Synechococcus sp. LTW-R]QNG29444.1 L-aspartate oxidase [Synechococcus sp. LTW-R]
MPSIPSNWDVIVVGGGAAGLMAALELPAGLSVLLLSKDRAPRSASRWAQGGIAAVTRPEDSFESHLEDTLKAGADLCDRPAVELLVREAPACVERLLELGMDFDRQDGGLSTTLEAAHSHRRVLHAQDRTGGALVDALERKVLQRPGLQRLQGGLALQLWMQDGHCRGLQVLLDGTVRWLQSRAVVLATGGAGHLFANTTNPKQASGDGIAMAYRAGAAVRDLEFIQFHPTALMLPGAPHFLISEAVRGEGARLIDDQGDSPVSQLSGADLAPRDAVSRALVQRMRERQIPHLWLDLRPVGSSKLERQFPTILGRCRELGLEPTQAPIPVAPAAHYCMGGVRTDGHSATTIPGLYAVGEVASSGVHGANRLASNSLMECLVYARQLREIELSPAGPTRDEPTVTALSAAEPSSSLETIARQTEQLRQLCWQVAGVERDGHALLAGYRACRQLEGELSGQPLLQVLQSLDKVRAVKLPQDQARWLGRAHDLQQRATVAALLMESALFRAESRGGHFRVDVPAQQPFWRRHSLQRQGLSISTEALAD